MKMLKQLRFKLLSRKLIKYAIGEIILIVIGILIAFQLSNWTDRRKAGKIEVETLRGLAMALRSDQNDLDGDIWIYQKQINACDTVLALLDDLIPYHEQMNRFFSGANLVVVFVSNRGPYEALKSRGLEIVSNDTIRSRIAELYEFDYRVLHEFEMHLTTYVQFVEKDFNPTHFDETYMPTDGIYGPMRPKNLAHLKKNQEYRHHVRTIRNKTRFLLKMSYQSTLKKVKRLVNDLDREIDRLQ